MKLLINTETERELARRVLSNVNLPGLTDSDLEVAGSMLTRGATQSLFSAAIPFSRTYERSAGADQIVQSATDSERALWDSAVDSEVAAADTYLANLAEQFRDRQYQIALCDSDGEWDVVEDFYADSDEEANKYAEDNHADKDWYVLHNGHNINA